MSKEAFWKLMLEDPLPRRLVSPDFPKVILMDTLSPTHAERMPNACLLHA